MRNLIVVGSQWGDEGKAKVIDVLAGHFDITGRYQGGGNAGHTVIVKGEKIIFHLVPTGILHPGKKVLLGNGMVIHIPTLVKEMDELGGRGLPLADRLFISQRAHVILPSHLILEKCTEEASHKAKIGTTLRGIGPAYEDKIARRGMVMADLLDEQRFRSKLQQNTVLKRALVENIYQQNMISDHDMIDEYLPLIERIRPFVIDASRWLHEELSSGQTILAEGAQGTHLDVDHGTYPFVTSSNSTAGGVITGMGVGPRWFEQVLGICKAYITRVGCGPFPSEDLGPDGTIMRECGHEFGSTTGRPRRCGWFDVPVLRYAARINGLTALAVTKLDVLSAFKTIKICQQYKLGHKTVKEFPEDPGCIDLLRPDYIEVKGWTEDITACSCFEELPPAAIDYLRRLEDMIEVEIAIVSVGPERDRTILMDSTRFCHDFPNIVVEHS